jgi:hypothetical protein
VIRGGAAWRPAAVGAILAGVGLCGCGSATPATTSATRTAAPTASPTATPAPTATVAVGTDAVEVTATGLGAYLETAVPVAIVHNRSLVDTAQPVTVHFRVLTASGSEAGSADTTVARLLPDQTAAITARVGASASGGRAEASVIVGGFANTPPAAALDHVDQVMVTCSGCGSRSGSGDATGRLVLAGGGGSTRTLEAACSDAGGGLVGGGSEDVSLAGAPEQHVDVPVILSANAQNCRIDVFAQGF